MEGVFVLPQSIQRNTQSAQSRTTLFVHIVYSFV
jgi:hypothetical protein